MSDSKKESSSDSLKKKETFKAGFFASRTLAKLDKFTDDGLVLGDGKELTYSEMKKKFNDLVVGKTLPRQPYRVMKHVAEKILPSALEKYQKAFSNGDFKKAAQVYNGARLVFCLLVHWTKNLQRLHLHEAVVDKVVKKGRDPKDYYLSSLLGKDFYFPPPHPLLLENPAASNLLKEGRVTDLLLNLMLAYKKFFYGLTQRITAEQQQDFINCIKQLKKQGHVPTEELQYYFDLRKDTTDPNHLFNKDAFFSNPKFKILAGARQIKNTSNDDDPILATPDVVDIEALQAFYKETATKLIGTRMEDAIGTILPKALFPMIVDYIVEFELPNAKITNDKEDQENMQIKPLTLMS